MADTNRELAERGYAALNAGDLEAFLEIVHPEVEFGSLVAEAEGRSYRGHEGVREWWGSVRDSMRGLHFEVQDMRDFGDRMVTQVRVTGEVGGVEIPQGMWQALRVRDGRPVWWQTFRTEGEAMRAVEEQGRRDAGLSEPRSPTVPRDPRP